MAGFLLRYMQDHPLVAGLLHSLMRDHCLRPLPLAMLNAEPLGDGWPDHLLADLLLR